MGVAEALGPPSGHVALADLRRLKVRWPRGHMISGPILQYRFVRPGEGPTDTRPWDGRPRAWAHVATVASETDSVYRGWVAEFAKWRTAIDYMIADTSIGIGHEEVVREEASWDAEGPRPDRTWVIAEEVW